MPQTAVLPHVRGSRSKGASMKREDVKTIFPDATKEQIDSLMALYGAGIEQEKEKRKTVDEELASRKSDLDKLKADFEKLKESNAGAEDYKAKFEQLQAKIAEDEQKAKAAAAEKEKADKIAERFAAVVGDKKFSHAAIRADYLNRFTAALADDANAGKSDADIFHNLSKDDAAAFVGVQAVNLKGAKNDKVDLGVDDATARSIMGLPPLKE